jgi:hypothetical protein
MQKFRRETIVINENFSAAGQALAEAVVRTIEGVPPERLQTIDEPPGDTSPGGVDVD